MVAFNYGKGVGALNATFNNATEGTLTPNSFYFYRWTFEYSWGDFLGESNPQFYDDLTKLSYWTAAVNTGSTDINSIKIYRTDPEDLDATGLTRINIYRSSPRAESTGTPEGYPSDKSEYFHIKTIDIDTYNDASVGDTLFTDYGSVPAHGLEYSKMSSSPNPMFVVNHKNRLWCGNVKYQTYGVEPWANNLIHTNVTAPHKIFISSINNNGVSAPLEFYLDQNVDVEPFGDGITGMVSFNNDVLVVFKANSMWGVYGDDPVGGNISVRQLSDSVGCIAPESITKAEGNLVWLSNSGVFHWNGASRPAPLKGDNIATSIQEIPDGTKKNACSIYDPERREILLAHAGPNTSGYNRIVEHFYLRTGTWGQDNPTESGYSSFLAKKEPDEETAIIAGVGDSPFAMTTLASLYQLNANNFDNGGNVLGILAGLQTKHYDGGTPFMDKDFIAILIEGKFHKLFTDGLHVVCDNRLDTRTGDGGGFDIPPTNSASNYLTWYVDGSKTTEMWYEDSDHLTVWAKGDPGHSEISLDSRTWGKRISLVFSLRTLEQIGIDSITVFYKPKTGSRR